MYSSGELNALAESLAKAQGVMVPAKKGAENPFFKSKYADLASVWDVCRGPLSENGLSIVQAIAVPAPGETILQTILLHTSGQLIVSSYPVKPVKDDPQGMGSAITYARRYALMAMIGIAPEDDDGESAVRRAPKDGPVEKKAAASSVLATDAQIRKLHIDAKAAGLDEAGFHDLIQKKFGVKSSKELTKVAASALIESFQKVAVEAPPDEGPLAHDLAPGEMAAEEDLFPKDPPPAAPAKESKQADMKSKKPEVGESKVADIKAYIQEKQKFSSVQTVDSWIVHTCKISLDDFNADPDGKLAEIKELMGW